MSKAKWLKTPFGIRLPARFPCAGVWYTMEAAKLENDYGNCDQIAKRIQLDFTKMSTVEVMWVTVDHEVGHAIEYEYGLRRSEKDNDREAQGRTQFRMALMSVQ